MTLAGIIGGATAWSTHFVAMLGYQTTLLIGYNAVLTVASLALVVVTTSIGFYIAAYCRVSWRAEAGGAVIGAGIALMHYVGLHALEVQGDFVWEWGYVIASFAFAILFSALALNQATRPTTYMFRYSGKLAFVLGIVALHFTGMTALTIVPHALVMPSTTVLSPSLLAGGVIAVMLILGLVAMITYMIDLQNARHAGERYRHLALHDPLTGVENRAGLEEHIETLMTAYSGDTARIAVVAIDLNRFKEINDVHGHAAGDQVLRVFAARASEALRDGEFLSRFGGDEFVAVKHPVYSRRDAAAFAARLLAVAQRGIEWKDTTLSVSGSAGYALYPEDARSPAGLIEYADIAMYHAKSHGEVNAVAYDPSLAAANRERSVIAMDLSGAVERGEFELYYQPQNDVATREVLGYEALIRWHHPTLGMVSPAVFIPVAEETGQITHIGAWALLDACREAASWEKPLTVAVNVAAAQLASEEFVRLVREILLETGLEPHRLELEMTESGIIGDVPHALHMVRQLKKLGVRIAMDDFGTGYSSLATLQNFPFDKIKIDREFIGNLGSNQHSAAIIKAAVILGASLDKTVVAEGVESEEHMTFLEEVGCNTVQGYLFGKPQPVSAILRPQKPAEADPGLQLKSFAEALPAEQLSAAS
ncbi:EAL domain-containing protein [Oricola sp.]|uniref:putative bifunctional diguanylate cyclase/phosphodiesterase n=1 Tax=Oricola sp. TaxID=1979950 RepID=UPI0025D04423|nr:EAL domain-containing protein [Oricola sp.]MCI5075804.1 EAL domain-containing protein [Oricola sp.]